MGMRQKQHANSGRCQQRHGTQGRSSTKERWNGADLLGDLPTLEVPYIAGVIAEAEALDILLGLCMMSKSLQERKNNENVRTE